MTAVPAAATSGTRPAAVPWGRARNSASTSGRSRRVDHVAGRREVGGCVAADRLVAAAARGQRDDVDERVAVEEPDQLGADVAGRADDPDADPQVRSGPAVRRDRRLRLQARAHGRARPFAEGRLLSRAGIGWTADMGA